MKAQFSAPRGIGGEVVPPPDKSITHRALLLASVAEGTSTIGNILDTGDCRSTRGCLERLGVPIEDIAREPKAIRVHGRGLLGYREPPAILDAENSGTTIRLLSGLLAALPLYVVLTGDASLLRRPMQRVVEPLKRMGARIAGRDADRYAPLTFLPGDGSLRAVDHHLEVASAQVKSALLLAALRVPEVTRITGRIDSRDHTERLLRFLGLPLREEAGGLALSPCPGVPAFQLEIPGDISSAAFWLTAALISGRELAVRGCGLNPTRLGFLRTLEAMGADLQVDPEGEHGGEPVGAIRLRASEGLRGVAIGEAEVPSLIDEIPLVAILALFASGTTAVRGAGELRVKESDRLQAIARLVEAVGGRIRLEADGFTIEGGRPLSPGRVEARGDHRIAMAAAVLGAGIPGGVTVEGMEAATVSYPDFPRHYRMLGGSIE
jgi:3-phosphoshikimate 1-carboxyvinyltransferase